MQELSYGYLKPENTDRGDAVFPALQTNIQKLNDHTHNGENSAPLGVATVNLPSGSWLALGSDGLYYQDIAIALPFSYDTADVWFRLSTGEPVYPSVTRNSANSIRVFTNNNALQYTAFIR